MNGISESKRSKRIARRTAGRALKPIVLLAVVTLLSLSAEAQEGPIPTPSPKATPKVRSEVPVVVSRDSDITNRSGRSGAGVRESLEGTERSGPEIRTGKTAGTVSPEKPLTSQDQQQMVMFLEILTKAEQRAESLRKQLFEMIEKYNSVTTKIQQINYRLRPDVIASYTALSGSLRPEDLREQTKNNLEIEKRNLESLLQKIESTRQRLEESVRRADRIVEKVRERFEKLFEKALSEEEIP